MDRNKNFTYLVEEQVIETEPTEPGFYTTNCITCNRTCHENCTVDQLEQCPAMDRNGLCKVCPKNCHWSAHKNQPYVYVIRSHRTEKIVEALKRRYEEAKQRKTAAESKN